MVEEQIDRRAGYQERVGGEANPIGRINREAFRRPVTVHPWTARVLRHARAFHDASNGLFDCAVGFEMMRSDLLPSEDLDHVSAGDFNEVHLAADRSVHMTAPVAINLGGIAKGYAVDRAIASLRAAGIRHATVNAGGDLRVYGPQAQTLLLRCADGSYLPCELHEAALAVSDLDAAHRPAEHRGYYVRETGTTAARRYAAVRAPEAMVADALTKCVVLCAPPLAQEAQWTPERQ